MTLPDSPSDLSPDLPPDLRLEHLSREDLMLLVKQLSGQVKASLTERAETLEQTYEAVHNGPLQALAVLLRADDESALSDPVRSQLEEISQDLRGIYQSMRLAIQSEALYLESGLALNLEGPLTQLLQQVFEHTLERDFPGYESLQFQITPDFTPLATAELSTACKRGLCLFLQEALCNVGKHALGTTQLRVECEHNANTYCLRITDNGETPSVIESLLQSLTESPAADQQKKHQGTYQAEALAQQLKGKFLRRPNSPQGTICELIWPQLPRSSQAARGEPAASTVRAESAEPTDEW